MTPNFADGLKWGVGVQGGLIGVDFSWKSTNPRKTTVTAGAGTLAAGGIMVGWERDDDSGLFGEIMHEILGPTALNIGFGTKSGKFFGLSIAPDLSSVYLNLGFGMSLPLSASVPLFEINPFIGEWLYDLLHSDPNHC